MTTSVVAQLALADDRLVRRVQVLDGGQRDALEILRLEALEQRHAAEQAASSRGRRGSDSAAGISAPSFAGLAAPGGRSTGRHHRAARAHRIAILSRHVDLVLEQADQRARQATIAGRVERLDRLRPVSGSPESQACGG